MSQVKSFLQAPTGLRQLVDSILDEQLDVIIFPEIGMDPMTIKVASMRLAPVQIAAWGHPETTGLPTIDYYLSGEDFEPPGAQQYYREDLVALPHLGCCYEPLAVSAVEPDLDALGVDTTSSIFVCPGTPYKYAPQNDWIFTEVAGRVKKCQFIFFDNDQENLSEKLKQRLEYAFTQADLYFDEHVVFIPWLPRPAFYGLLKRADIYLDTLGFSGFNSAMQAVECGLPIVTREGRFMRGRLASGIFRRMGMPELIAKTDEEYVNLAVKLGLDTDFRRLFRERVESSRQVLFDDLASVRGLEKFLLDVTRVSQTQRARR